MEKFVEATREFVKQSFIKNPHYSFNHWSVMYNHSCTVEEIALEIAKEVESNKLVVSLGALLHDIGKTYHADAQMLHKNHESFNLQMSEEFLDELGLSASDLAKVKSIISGKGESIEAKIIKDADALAFYKDKTYICYSYNGQLTTTLAMLYKERLTNFQSYNLM